MLQFIIVLLTIPLRFATEPSPTLLEKFVIGLNNLSVSKTAPSGTVVGTLALLNQSRVGITASFILDEGACGFFTINGYNIVTVAASLPAGDYSVCVKAVGEATYWSDKAYFTITVS